METIEDTTDTILTELEFQTYIENLSDGDILKLGVQSRRLAKMYGFEVNELLNAAMVNGLDRLHNSSKPVKVRPIVFLYQVMRSIGSTKLKSQKDESGEIDILVGLYSDPYISVAEDEEIEKILKIFDDKSHAKVVIAKVLEGYSRKEIKNEVMTDLGISETEYSSLRKLIKRRLTDLIAQRRS